VDIVTVYQTHPIGRVPDQAREALQRRGAIVTFTSPSTVEGFVNALGADGTLMRDAVVACLGPPTAEAAQRHGLAVAIQPRVQSMAALVEAIIAHVTTTRRES
jgi:uroporphyrinogen III methyltransferase/synthase